MTTSTESPVARAWDDAAAGYDAYFVPRFAPWVRHALEALTIRKLPAGPLVAPCCGTAPELALLHDAMPERELLGVDLSPGMIQLAQARLRGLPRIELRVDDAMDTQGWGEPAGILSCFGLQLMPAPAEALEAWTRALRPGGVMSVIFWPTQIDAQSPFAWARAAVTSLAPPTGPAPSWEEELRDAVARGGATLVTDERVQATMRHDDAHTFWEATSGSGPLRALANHAGAEFMEQVRARFMQHAPAGPIEHTQHARHIVAIKRA